MTSEESAARYIEPIGRKTRGAQVLDALADMVEKAGLKVGDRLPPETTLAERCGVGRSTVREALNRWEGLGIIRRKQGDGTYLTASVRSYHDFVPTSVRLEGEALLRLMQVRRALEQSVVRMAAENASTAQSRDIAQKCDVLLDLVASGQPWSRADADFHAAVYDASANPMFGRILQRLDEVLERSKESPFGQKEFGLASFPMHRDLSDAITARDPDAAVLAIDQIIDSVEDEIRRMADL